MAKGYCLYNGNTLNARKIKDRIKVTSNYEIPGLDKIIDDYGQEVWQKYIQVEECEDYYEVYLWIIIGSEKMSLSLSIGGEWIIETTDESIAHKFDMIEVDRNVWNKVLSGAELLEANYEIAYKHLDTKLDESIQIGVWEFLNDADKLFYGYAKEHLAYKSVIKSILQAEHEQSENGAMRIYSKIVQFDDLFDELIYLCRFGELKEANCVEVEGYSATALNKSTYLTQIGSINFLSYLRRNPEKALADLKAGLPRK